jgi:hypothetical protein
MTIAKENMSASLLGAEPFKTSGADHCVLLIRRVVPPRESEGVTIGSSGIIVSRLNPAKRARPLLSIRIFDLDARST